MHAFFKPSYDLELTPKTQKRKDLLEIQGADFLSLPEEVQAYSYPTFNYIVEQHNAMIEEVRLKAALASKENSKPNTPAPLTRLCANCLR